MNLPSTRRSGGLFRWRVRCDDKAEGFDSAASAGVLVGVEPGGSELVVGDAVVQDVVGGDEDGVPDSGGGSGAGQASDATPFLAALAAGHPKHFGALVVGDTDVRGTSGAAIETGSIGRPRHGLAAAVLEPPVPGPRPTPEAGHRLLARCPLARLAEVTTPVVGDRPRYDPRVSDASDRGSRVPPADGSRR